MKKLIAVLMTGMFAFSLILPINSFASEEIQLAAAIGNNSARTVDRPVRSETIDVDTKLGSTGILVGTVVAIGAGIAGVVTAAKKTESTSSH